MRGLDNRGEKAELDIEKEVERLHVEGAVNPALHAPIKLEEVPGGQFVTVDITPYLCTPQKDVAKLLGIPRTTLSYRFSKTTRRRWPHRRVKYIDEQIMGILNNVVPGSKIPDDLKVYLGKYMRERKEILSPVRLTFKKSNFS